ncbi:unnamed protein product [Cochlearia groenlandica]
MPELQSISGNGLVSSNHVTVIRLGVDRSPRQRRRCEKPGRCRRGRATYTLGDGVERATSFRSICRKNEEIKFSGR